MGVNQELRVARSHLQRCLERGVCPVCGTGKVSYGQIEVNREEALQDAACECGATWTEHYKISRIDELNVPGRTVLVNEKA